MSSLIATVPMNGGVNNVSQVQGVAPAGVVPSSRAYVAVWVTNAGPRNWTVTSSGATPTVVKLDDQNLGVTGNEMALFEITGVTAGDTLTFAFDTATGKAGGRQVWHDNTTQTDTVGIVATTGTSATETVPGVTTSEANEYAFTIAAGVGSAARTVSSVSGQTSQVTGTSGGTNRFWADVYSDETITTSGTSTGTTTIVFSGTLIAFAGWQVTLKAVVAPTSTVSTVMVNGVVTAVGADRAMSSSHILQLAPTKVMVGGSLV